MNYYVTGLDAPEALSIAHRLWEILSPAVNRAPDSIRYSYQGLFEEVARKETQVWVIIDLRSDEIVGAFTTALATDERLPGVNILEVPLVAGRKMREWLGVVLKTLNGFGEEHGCDILVAYGRRGWERLAGFCYWGEDGHGVRIMTRPIGGFH